MSISSITSTASTPTYATPGAPSTTTSTAQAAAPTAATSVAMAMLSQEAGIVATLGGAPSGFQTYDATGLLNQVAQASNAAAGAGVTAQPPAADGTSTSQDPSTTTSPSSDTSVAAAVPGDWGSILKSNPALTSVAVADAVAQGIVNTINVYA
jgi:hypothetical protein